MITISDNITITLMNHLKARVLSGEEENLGAALEYIKYDLERLTYYIENNKIILSFATGSLIVRYSREFMVELLGTLNDLLFIDYKNYLKPLVDGDVELSYAILNELLPSIGVERCNLIENSVKMCQAIELRTDFTWQIVGTSKLFISPNNYEPILELPLDILDYLVLERETHNEKS